VPKVQASLSFFFTHHLLYFFTHQNISVLVNHTNTVRYILDYLLPPKSESSGEKVLYRDDISEEEIHSVIGKNMGKHKARNTNLKGRLDTVDLLIKIAYFVKKYNNIFSTKSI
jgi:hypothetical protein